MATLPYNKIEPCFLPARLNQEFTHFQAASTIHPKNYGLSFLQHQYGLIPVVLEFLPLGHDYDAGVYRVLRDQGITSIVAPVSTTSDAL